MEGSPLNTPVALETVLVPTRVRMLSTNAKGEALQALLESVGSAPEVTDVEALARGIFEREALMSTGIGLGIAVPHVRLPSVTGVVMAVGVSDRDIMDYESLDGMPVRMIFMIAARQDQHPAYLRLLALVSNRLKDEGLRQQLLAQRDPQEFYGLLTQPREAA